jgi:hypothetical protein
MTRLCDPLNSIDKPYLQKYYQRAARVRRFTTISGTCMKEIVRLSVLSALVLGTSMPAFSAPSDSDMGFASSREPSVRDAGGTSEVNNVRGTSYTGSSAGQGPYAGADNGDQSNFARPNTDTTWFGQGRDTRAYLINQPYRADSQGQSQTQQRDFQALTDGVKTSTSLLGPNSTSDVSFRGPQNLGFKGAGALTPFAMRHGYWTRATGTGSVNASITSANGKD